ncbi:MAG TPA: transglycosylase SLT domain-containing protein [Rhodopila sp.]|nr:transglycosylase SLT domain-containing protein [Rhodopila sp.]
MAGGVWRRHRIVAAGLLSAALSFAGASPARAGAGESCRDQAAIAERSAGIPAGLLLAIGKRESGRFDPQVGGVLPWPWAVNRAGEGRLLASREAAIAYVAAAQQSGTLSIDVGCFQINLKSHPLAFASLDEAFDPAANAAYAARFLAELHDRTGSWEAAVASYHSATPWIGAPYREAVFATWLGLPQGGMTAPVQPLPYQEIMGIRLWTPGLAAAAPAPVVHPAAVRTVAFAARAGHPVSDPFVALRPSGHLPKVVTPATTVRVRLGG